MSTIKTRWKLFRKFGEPIVALFVILLIGTVGYVWLNQYGWLNAFYMTAITVGTVGFGEVEPLNNAGKLFTVFLILASIIVIGFYVAKITRMLLDGEWRRNYDQYKQAKKIDNMENHVIVCGYGRNGKQACEILRKNKLPFAVIEKRQQYLESIGAEVDLVIQGDATKDEVLLDAGILKAAALISALPDDADNLFVVLTARQLNRNLLIVSRASDDHTIAKLKIAGATNVIMPDKLGGVHMASLVLIPDVHEFLGMLSTQQNDEFRLSEISVGRNCTLGELNLWMSTGCTILGLKRADGEYVKNPGPEYYVQVGEFLIIMGNKQQLLKAARVLE